MIAITHTPTDGTILEGTTRGDGTNQLLKPLTWRWSRHNRRLVSARVAGRRTPHRRHHRHRRETPRRRARSDRRHRRQAPGPEVVEADRAARQQARADALADKAARDAAASPTSSCCACRTVFKPGT